VPKLTLFSCQEGDIDLDWLTSATHMAHGAVVHFFPGGGAGDYAQVREFDGYYESLGAIGYRLAGICAQEPGPRIPLAIHVQHLILADPDLACAQALDLPTAIVGGIEFYPRLTLIAEAGRVTKVFFPAGTAADVYAWVRQRGRR